MGHLAATPIAALTVRPGSDGARPTTLAARSDSPGPVPSLKLEGYVPRKPGEVVLVPHVTPSPPPS
eukprot:673719-Hanusia_phi.AAC.1